MKRLVKLVVGRIEDQGDRVLLYPIEEHGFYVIASRKQASNLREGDTIEYEPYGVNFGWFHRVL